MPLLAVVWAACAGQEEFVDQLPEGRTLMDWVESDLVGESEIQLPILDELVLYIDLSNSMQGYVRPAGSEFSQVLNRLDTFAANLQPRHGISFRTVGASVAEASADIDLLGRLSHSPELFDQTQSVIADAIRSFDNAFRLERNETTGVPRCHVLITDGVQYVAPGAATACRDGNDAQCVNEEIRSLIAKGWGVHVFAVRSRFNGKVWQHSRSVPGNKVPSATYHAGAGDLDDYRPFLVMLFTTEASYVGHVADSLRADLGKIGFPAGIVKEIPLTVRLIEATHIAVHAEYLVTAEDEAVEDEGVDGEPNPLIEAAGFQEREIPTGLRQGQQMPEWVRVVRYQYDDPNFVSDLPFALGVKAELKLTPAGRAWFEEETVEAAAIMKSLAVRSVARPQSWSRPQAESDEQTPEQGEAAEDEVTDEPQLTAKVLDFLTGGDVLIPGEMLPPYIRMSGEGAEVAAPEVLHLPMRWSVSGDYVPHTLLRIDGELDPNRTVIPPWVESWSTPDDSSVKSFNRILNLDRLFTSLQANGILERQGMQPVYVHIEPNLLN